ncbi:metal ABC transporter ATP-binding protein [Herbivorax sp. ANBcel31]|uniref:metal ABC transporter ATP-binding protein n=1 Tax=Herbivorax sp. ANBcel31 TaxID=3069754 RepID=UPI0027AE918E|nr:metal ABC transporter ATP-binding protein [Herbivorax sp. ANBcel31]MDQ2086576.1 metal ABC transporter ATP-binding protein [Herbivorax sp. ANBcel31]
MYKKALEVSSLTTSYNDKPVLWDINVAVPEGIIMGIIGPNGAGKSTFIKSLLGIVKPIAGSAKIYGKPYKKIRKKVAYVPQRESVDWDFPTTVLDVVTMGLYGDIGWIKRPGKKEKQLSLNALEKLGMEKYHDRQISKLSGGQQQRTFLARALVQDADLFLMDEPFQGVDALTEKIIIDFMKELKNKGKTIVAVHHNLETASEYFDWIMMLNIKCIAVGPCSEVFIGENLAKTYSCPKTPYQSFIVRKDKSTCKSPLLKGERI